LVLVARAKKASCASLVDHGGGDPVDARSDSAFRIMYEAVLEDQNCIADKIGWFRPSSAVEAWCSSLGQRRRLVRRWSTTVVANLAGCVGSHLPVDARSDSAFRIMYEAVLEDQNCIADKIGCFVIGGGSLVLVARAKKASCASLVDHGGGELGWLHRR
jgi:hypothetical protein